MTLRRRVYASIEWPTPDSFYFEEKSRSVTRWLPLDDSHCGKTVMTDPREGIVDWAVLMLVIRPILACFFIKIEHLISWFDSCHPIYVNIC